MLLRGTTTIQIVDPEVSGLYHRIAIQTSTRTRATNGQPGSEGGISCESTSTLQLTDVAVVGEDKQPRRTPHGQL